MTNLTDLSALLSSSYTWDSIRLFLLGALIEAGRELFYWIVERFRYAHCITAEFRQGDASYEWVLHLLTQEQVWHRSRKFRVNQKNSRRQWSVKNEGPGDADYVPIYNDNQLFRWNGYWVEISRNRHAGVDVRGRPAAVLYISIYTLDLNVLCSFVESARERYKEANRNSVTIHTARKPRHTRSMWATKKSKALRPLNSIVLRPGVVDSLVEDIREFLESEEWYREAGIPHRRGYLLYGPPGTGKTSTIYALAGALEMEIYSLSLSSSFVDDSFLERAISSMSKSSILLIEDIDCAFPSRDAADLDSFKRVQVVNEDLFHDWDISWPQNSTITFSGLLNAIDGIGSDEGRVFIATTNWADRLDPALLRPGRIDVKIEYKLATHAQASALFVRFFGRAVSQNSTMTLSEVEDLATQFTASIPEHEFSIAELQGFLVTCKDDPKRAVESAGEWVGQYIAERETLGRYRIQRSKKRT